MWMWTVGYTVGDALYIAQTTADQRRANWCSKGVWVVVLMCFLAYAGYQTYLCYQSYTDPDWAAGVEFQDELDFPTVLICPMKQYNAKPIPPHHGRDSDYDRMMVEPTCSISNGTDDIVRPCQATVVVPTRGRFKGDNCTLYNGDVNDIATATFDEHSFMDISFTITNMRPNERVVPFAVILYSPNARVTKETPAEDSPSFIVVAGNSYWALLTQEQDVYLDGPMAIQYYPSISSSAIPLRTVNVTFSYSAFAISYNYQVVTYDWLTLLGTCGGAAALACAVHEIVMIIYVKCAKCCCPSMVEEEDEEENEEKKGKREATKEEPINWNASTGKPIISRSGKWTSADDEDYHEQSLDSFRSRSFHGSFSSPSAHQHDHVARDRFERRPLLLDDTGDASSSSGFRYAVNS